MDVLRGKAGNPRQPAFCLRGGRKARLTACLNCRTAGREGQEVKFPTIRWDKLRSPPEGVVQIQKLAKYFEIKLIFYPQRFRIFAPHYGKTCPGKVCTQSHRGLTHGRSQNRLI